MLLKNQYIITLDEEVAWKKELVEAFFLQLYSFSFLALQDWDQVSMYCVILRALLEME